MHFFASILLLCAGVSASVISVRQSTNGCPESCYGDSSRDSEDTTYYHNLCMDQTQLRSIVTCFRDTCPGNDASINNLEDRCAMTGVTLTIDYSPNSFRIDSSLDNPPTSTSFTTMTSLPPTTNPSTAAGTHSTSAPAESTSPHKSDTDSGFDTQESKLPVGTIIGGVIGGTVPFVLLLIGAFLLWKHQQNSEVPSSNPLPHLPSTPEVREALPPGQNSPSKNSVSTHLPPLRE